jgi:hypothetical protein
VGDPVPVDDGSGVLSSVPLDESSSATADLPKQVDEAQKDKRERELHEQALKLRGRYGAWVLALTIFQVVAINVFFGVDAIGYVPINCVPYHVQKEPFTCLPFHVSDDLFKVFAVSVFASVIALGYGVTRSLFPGEQGGFWSFVLGLFGKKPE